MQPEAETELTFQRHGRAVIRQRAGDLHERTVARIPIGVPELRCVGEVETICPELHLNSLFNLEEFRQAQVGVEDTWSPHRVSARIAKADVSDRLPGGRIVEELSRSNAVH